VEQEVAKKKIYVGEGADIFASFLNDSEDAGNDWVQAIKKIRRDIADIGRGACAWHHGQSFRDGCPGASKERSERRWGRGHGG